MVHEFPQREEVFVEDLGAAATRFTVQAFVLGPDYMDARDELERVLSEPGPGTLVHPWYGEITVSQFAPYKVRHSAQDGGMAVFTLSFARDGAPSSPSSGVNQQVRSLNKAAGAGNLACAVFDEAFQVASQTAYVVEQAYQAVTDAVERVQAILGGDVSAIAATLGAVTGYDFLPWVSVGQQLWGVYQGLGDAALAGGKSRADLAADWQTAAALAVPTPVAASPGSTRARIAGNETAVNTFTRHIAVVEAARNLALAVPESRAQAQNLREGFMDALDLVLAEEGGEAAPVGLTQSVLPDELYAALVETRSATLATLAEAAHAAPDVISYTPAAVLPTLAICYRLSGDISLDTDLAARNHIIHPGFVPVEQLEVLTYG